MFLLSKFESRDIFSHGEILHSDCFYGNVTGINDLLFVGCNFQARSREGLGLLMLYDFEFFYSLNSIT